MTRAERKALITILGVDRVSALSGIPRKTVKSIKRGTIRGHDQRRHDHRMEQVVDQIYSEVDVGLNAATVAASFAKGVTEATRLEAVDDATKLDRIRVMAEAARKRLTNYIQQLKDLPTQ